MKSNPPLGVQLAEQALKASGGDDLELLDLLARAHFEVGRAKAIEVTRKAVAVATEHATFDEDAEGDLEFAREMLENYTTYDPHEPLNGANDNTDEEKENVPAEPAPSLKVGDPAPALTVGKWIKGEPVGKFEAGTIYVLEFWATWCGPCVQVIPHITALQKRYPEMVFIGVNVWENDTAKIAPFISKLGDQMDYRVVLDDVAEGDEGGRDGIMATSWLKPAGMKGIPVTVIVGKDGKILWMGHPAGLEPVLEAVAQGKPIE